jgi:hypothetical protein
MVLTQALIGQIVEWDPFSESSVNCCVGRWIVENKLPTGVLVEIVTGFGVCLYSLLKPVAWQ